MRPSRSDQNPSRCWPLGCTLNFSSQQDSRPDAMDAWRVLQRCASRSAAGADRLPRPVRDSVRCLCCNRAGGRRVFDLVSICRCVAPRLDSCASATALTARCSLVWQEASRSWPASTAQPARSSWARWSPFKRSGERSVSGCVAGMVTHGRRYRAASALPVHTWSSQAAYAWPLWCLWTPWAVGLAWSPENGRFVHVVDILIAPC